MKPVGCFKQEPVLGIGAQASHRNPFSHRRIEGRHKCIDIIADLVPQHEAMRMRSLIGETRQLALPVRSYKTEAVPSLAAPDVPRTVLFENNMIDAAVGQEPADGKVGLATSDHGNRVVDGDSFVH